MDCLEPGFGWIVILRRTCSDEKNSCSFQDLHSLTNGESGFLTSDVGFQLQPTPPPPAYPPTTDHHSQEVNFESFSVVFELILSGV